MKHHLFCKGNSAAYAEDKWGRLITITSSAVKQPVDGLLLSNSNPRRGDRTKRGRWPMSMPPMALL